MKKNKSGNQALTLVNKANASNRDMDAIPLNAINFADTALKLVGGSNDASSSDVDRVDEQSEVRPSYALGSFGSGTIHIGQYAGHVTIEQGNRKARLNEYTGAMSTAKGSCISSSGHQGTLKHIPIASFTIEEDQLASLKQAISYRNKLATSTSEEGDWIYMQCRSLDSRRDNASFTPPSSTNGYMAGNTIQLIGFDGRSVMIHNTAISTEGSNIRKAPNAFRVELKTFSDMIGAYDTDIRISIGENSIQISDHQLEGLPRQASGTLTLTAPISDAEGKANAKMDMIEKLWTEKRVSWETGELGDNIHNVIKVADIGELANAAIFASAMCDNRGDGIYIQIEKDNGEYIDIEGVSTDGGNNKTRLNVRVMNPQPIRKCIAPIAITNLKIWKDASASINIGKSEKDKVAVRIGETRLIIMPMHIQ